MRRGLAARLVGRRITHVTVRRPDLRRPLPPDMGQALTGRAVQGFGRRGKYLLVHLDNGSVLIVHLGMSGRLSIDVAPSGGAHEHVVLHFDDGAVLRYDDHRRFGLMDLTESARLEEHELLRSMGPEPLAADFDGPALAKRLSGKDTPIKAALLDQRVVAGLGNSLRVRGALLRRAEPQAPGRLGARQARGPAGHRRSGTCWKRPSQPADRRSETMCRRRASSATFSTASRFTTGRICRAPAATAGPRCAASCKAGARHSIALSANGELSGEPHAPRGARPAAACPPRMRAPAA